MFPLNSNDQYINENGKRASLGELFEGSEHDIEELETTVAGHTTKISALETLTGALQDQINPDEYSATESYTAGDYVIHDNVLYKCNTSCDADTWANNSQYFTATNVADELAAINSDLSKIILYRTFPLNLTANLDYAPFSVTPGYLPVSVVTYNYMGIYSVGVVRDTGSVFNVLLNEAPTVDTSITISLIEWKDPNQ